MRDRARFGVISITTMVMIVLVTLTVVAFVPAMKNRAQKGSNADPINPIFAAKVAEYHAQETYDWRNWRSAAPFGCLAWCGLIALVRRSIRDVRLQFALIAYSGLFLAYTVVSGPRHDYWAFLEIWENTLSGTDPWWIYPEIGMMWNAYGPLFLIFAPFAWLNPLLPKIFFSSSFLVLAIGMVRTVESQPNPPKYLKWALWGFLASPFFWKEIAFYAHFDVVVGLTLVAALAAFDRKCDARSGLMVGLGFLLKFMPAVVMPFLTLETRGRRMIHWRLATTFLVVSGGVMGLSWWAWGDSVVRPFTFASGRESTGISIWRYLKGANTPWALAGWQRTNLDAYSKYVLLLALAVVGLLHLRRKAHPIHSAFLAMMVTVNLYQVGYATYHMVPILMIPFWFWRFQEAICSRTKLIASLVIYFLWITAVDIKGPPGDWIGPFNLAIAVFLLVNLVEMMGAEETRTDEVSCQEEIYQPLSVVD